MVGKRYVFLSYGRKDVYPKGTTNAVEQEEFFPVVEKVYRHLYGLRDELGLEPWFDKYCFTHDREFPDSLFQAIEQADYMLLFIGKSSMKSEWCKLEWKHALARCVPIIPILLDGNWNSKRIKNTYPPRILNIDGIDPQRGDGTLDTNFLQEKVVSAIRHKPAPLAIPYNARNLPSYYIERPQYLEDLKKRLGINDHNYKSQSNIVGITSQDIGGIGKTTLALALCSDCDVRRAFNYIFWLDVGPEMTKNDAITLMQTIGISLNDTPDLYRNVQVARMLLQKHFSGKRILLVLDDVWADGLVGQFSLAGVDCRLVVTTRNRSLVENTQPVNKLNVEEGLNLLLRILNG